MKEHCDVLTREKKTVDCYPMCRMHRACAEDGTAAEETAADGALRILVPISGKMPRDGAISWIMKLPSV